MKIRHLTLHTDNLEGEKHFFHSKLGFELGSDSSSHFTVKAGWSLITFRRSEKPHLYHYCFLIPSNKLDEAMQWMEQRTTVVAIEGSRKTQVFESWNAESFYFHDASGNIAEFIVRYDLENETQSPFDISQVLCLNEIGMPVADIRKADAELTTAMGTSFWKGDYDRFGTHGDQDGLILLPNFNEKKDWFPTGEELRPEPFEVVVENVRRHGQRTTLKFDGEILSVG